MSKSAHSDLPWIMGEKPVDPYRLYDVHGTPVIVALRDLVPAAEARANIVLVRRATASFPELVKHLRAAMYALRSYQHGNGATALAREVADACEATLASVEAA